MKRQPFALFVIVAISMLFVACGLFKSSPTGPSVVTPPVVMPPVISVPPGATLNEGDQITVSISFSPGTGSVAIAWVLVRDDGAALKVVCGAGNGRGTMGNTITLAGPNYLWAKGHILNGATLETNFDDPNAALQSHGCYFLNPQQDPFSVHFDRATRRTDTVLNWWVN